MVSSYKVPFARVGSLLGQRELDVLQAVLSSGEALSQGGWRKLFEERFGEHVRSRYALSVTSGTVALELGIHLLDLKAGDEVIVTPQTYQATIQPLLDYNVKVRFSDVSRNSMNIDPERTAELITARTRAIILVHYGGYPADMWAIMKLAEEHGLVVVEDCAHALGGTYRDRPPGSLGHIGCFSFHSTKNITTLGEGGMLTVSRSDWAERAERLRSNQVDANFVASRQSFGPYPARPLHGALYPGNAYTHDCVQFRRAGTNATLSEPACAVGLVQLERLPDLVKRRRYIARRLADTLRKYEGIRLPYEPDFIQHPYHLFTFFIEPGSHLNRDELVRKLRSSSVEVQLRYFPLHLLPEWRSRGHGFGECPLAEELWFERQVNLPCHPGLSDDEVDYLIDALTAALGGMHQKQGTGWAKDDLSTRKDKAMRP